MTQRRLVSLLYLTGAALVLALVGTRAVVGLTETRHQWGGTGMDTFLLVLLAVGAGVAGLRVLLWLGYRPVRAPEIADLPPLTVVIPAYNEGPHVRRSIDSALRSDYPADLLSVIVVNDGSKDDTGEHIDAMARQHPRVRAIHLPANAGKRHALHAGFKATQTPFVVTLDSDSTLDADALKHMVAPLVAAPTIGGVAGKVAVANRGTSLITRMLAVVYVLGFDFIRAYQSRLRNVWCCPGALQAYRMELIRPHLDTWLNQTFLGARCTNGDDHAMTNLVLSLDADTCYQSNAVVRTLVPHTYKRLCKMYVRWGRSATREGLRALRFAPRRAARRGARGAAIMLDAIMLPLGVLLKCVSPLLLLGLLVTNPTLLGPMVLSMLLGTLLYSVVYLRSELSLEVVFAMLYAWFSLLTLFWIQPYATLTVRRNGWLTRG